MLQRNISNQNGNTAIIVAVVVFLLAVGGFFISQNNKNNSNDKMMQDDNAMMDDSGHGNNDTMMKDESDDAMMDNGDKMMQDDNAMMDDGDKMMQNEPGQYINYSKSAYKNAVDSKRVLFFAASWCPTCKQAEADFLANKNDIPSGVVILKTDYDKETALKQKYNITYQHTFVQVDKNGNELVKWNGGGVDELKKKLK